MSLNWNSFSYASITINSNTEAAEISKNRLPFISNIQENNQVTCYILVQKLADERQNGTKYPRGAEYTNIASPRNERTSSAAKILSGAIQSRFCNWSMKVRFSFSTAGTVFKNGENVCVFKMLVRLAEDLLLQRKTNFLHNSLMLSVHLIQESTTQNPEITGTRKKVDKTISDNKPQ